MFFMKIKNQGRIYEASSIFERKGDSELLPAEYKFLEEKVEPLFSCMFDLRGPFLSKRGTHRIFTNC